MVAQVLKKIINSQCGSNKTSEGGEGGGGIVTLQAEHGGWVETRMVSAR